MSGTGWKYVDDRRSGQRRLHQRGTDPGEERNLVDTYREVTRVLQRVMLVPGNNADPRGLPPDCCWCMPCWSV
ncbi:MAG: hypothetical protein EA424_00215, partial [Planctomycetaceae bacterium]